MPGPLAPFELGQHLGGGAAIGERAVHAVPIAALASALSSSSGRNIVVS